MGRTRATDTVVELLRREQPGLMLDIPAGGGPVTQAARSMGHRVVEVDLFPRGDLSGVRADACARLPFKDGSFDSLLCMEGIEHFENQTGFVRECARVLKPGGVMILSTPNVLHLGSRVAGFLTGQRLMHHGFINEHSTLRGRSGPYLYHGHAYLIDAFRLRYILRVVGLELESVRSTTVSASSAALSILYPALWLATRYTLKRGREWSERHRREPPPEIVERELARVALSPAVLFGKKLVVVGRKVA